MDSVSRLVVGLLIAALSFAANATTCTQWRHVYDPTGTGAHGGWQSTKAAACAESSGAVSDANTQTNSGGSTSTTGTSALDGAGACQYTGTNVYTATGYPPSTSAYNITVSLDSRTVECSDTCSMMAGKSLPLPEYTYKGGAGATPNLSASLCDFATQCMVAGGGSNALTLSEKGPDGVWVNRISGSDLTHSGTACTTPGIPESKAPQCAKGEVPGQINGTDVCVKSSTSTTTTTGTKTQTPAAGTTTTTKKTTCTDGVCTTVTTTIIAGASSGNGTSTVTNSDTQGAFCIANPTNPICAGVGGSNGTGSGTGDDGEGDEDPSTFGGTCASTSCVGDAVVCAIAREQAKRACELQQSLGDGTRTHSLAVAGDAALTAGDAPTAHPRNAANVTTGDLSGGFDQTRLIGASCPGDRVIAHVVVPFSLVCEYAAILGNVLIAFVSVACLGIVFKGS